MRRTFLQNWVEWAALRALQWAVLGFDPRRSVRWGRALGRFLCFLDFKHRGVCEKNLRACLFPRASDRALRRAARRVFENVGMIVTEILIYPRLVRKSTLRRHTELAHYERVHAALRRGKGLILVLGHMGNWEIAGPAFCLGGVRLHSVARPLDNPLLDGLVRAHRCRTGQGIVSNRDGPKGMMRVLRSNGVLAMVADQDARSDGVFVPFFGRPVSAVKGPALFALRLGCPIIPVAIHRIDDGCRHVVGMEEPIDPDDFRDHPDPARALTSEINRRIEAIVRRRPDQWLWIHRRFKTKPRTEEEIRDFEDWAKTWRRATAETT